ncbi:MerR family transcriptional regulator [Faunimonas sp. B44]|uniref:MerR family transcriptional regulator n=1 Tax=Faunimonas sp. B44 TaxID=3461493 RepID=UPI0040445E06
MKSPDAFRTISEVADELDLPQHVLRFWETRFAQIKPLKRGGGRRYYRPDDVDLLRGIRLLLYGEGFTIKGVQRLLKEKGIAFVIAAGQVGSIETVPAEIESPAPPPASEPADAAADRDPTEDDGRDDGWDGELGEQPAPPARPAHATAFGHDERRLLEAALGDLLEAKRMLDQAR